MDNFWNQESLIAAMDDIVEKANKYRQLLHNSMDTETLEDLGVQEEIDEYIGSIHANLEELEGTIEALIIER